MIFPLKSDARVADERLWLLLMRVLPPLTSGMTKVWAMRIAACLALMVFAAGAAAQTPTGTTDYDLNNNNLIDVRNSTQLQAITHDLNGDGNASNASTAAYVAAFPDAVQGMGCPTTCTGYELLNDVDLSGRDWDPIGGGSPLAYYTAVFEGNGHVISNLRIDTSADMDYAALFGAVGVGGRIRNVGVRNARVRVGDGSVFTSALVGRNDGRVAACWVAGGGVTGGWSAGALAGVNRGVIIASYADVEVHAAMNNSGGLIGEAIAGSVVSASYSIGEVRSGGDRRGGLVGQRNELDADEYDVQASYYDRGRSGQTTCCGRNMPSNDVHTSRTSAELRAPTTAVGTIYAGWDRLDLDGDGERNDAPWDFGSGFDYPLLRGVSARYLAGNTTNIGVQRRLQPPVLMALSQRSGGLAAEGSTVTYAVELDFRSRAAVTVSWSVETVGVGTGYAEAADFVGTTQETITLVNTNSAVFGVKIEEDGTSERAERFRVRLSNLRGPDNVRLRAASSSVISFIEPHGTDYDRDDNNLIDVATTSQLAAIRYDLGGMGLRGVADGDVIDYEDAFPFFDVLDSCPDTCTGYELLNDVDLAGVDWVPIGEESPLSLRYNAVFEGNGHIIRNLHVNDPGNRTGLFRVVGVDGVIRNVGLVDVDVSGRNTGGALVGDNYGKVAASYVVGGTVTLVAPSFGGAAGGLVGGNGGLIVASYVDVAVRVVGNGSLAGGLVYFNSGKVIASYSSGLFAGGDNAGGLVGIQNRVNPGEIENSYFDGTRSTWGNGIRVPATTRRAGRDLRAPTTAVGIYTGWNKLDVDGVDQLGDDDFNDDAPWDFGSGLDYPLLRGVSARYPTGNSTNVGVQRRLQPPVLVALSQRNGGLLTEGSTVTYAVGLDVSDSVASSGVVVAMSWSVEPVGVGDGYAEAADFVAVTRGVITLVNTNSAVFRVGIARDGTTEPRESFRVRLSALQASDRIALSVASSAVVSAIVQNGSDYDHDDNNLIDVATTSQLAAIRHDLGGMGFRGVADGDVAAYDRAFPGFDESGCPGGCKGYELVNDVDLSSVDNWMPIGGGGTSDRYDAVFEGNGHIVRNMKFTQAVGSDRYDGVGLFGALGAGGKIRSVGMENVSVHAPESVGVGALVGIAYGRIAASYAVGGVVTGSWAVGGLVGETRGGSVIAGYSDAAVHGRRQRAGGLIGSAQGVSIVSASYTIGVPTGGGPHRGGLMGYRGSMVEIQSSYFDRDRTGQTSCCGANPPSPDRSPRKFFELRTPTAAVGIYAGWDKLDVDDDGDFNDAPWDFGSSSDYPVLRGVSARYLTGNSTNVAVQRRLRPSVSLVALSQRSGDPIAEGSTVTYAVELGVRSTAAVTVSWSVELVGVGARHAEAADFVGATRGTVTLVDTASAVFGIRIAEDGTSESREAFRVRLSSLQAPDGVRLSAASSAVVSAIASHGTDYDLDNDNLIEVTTRSQLEAIGYDLGGMGLRGVADGDVDDYEAAFPLFDEFETCPGRCEGYELVNDLDLSGGNWDPIGGGGRNQLPGNLLPDENRYHGTFEGHGHVIENMRIVGGSNRWDFVGLFRGLGAASVVRNVGLVDVNVTVDETSIQTGALAGVAYGRIASSYVVRGSVTGGWGVGGLVGALTGAKGRVVASYTNVSVSAATVPPNRAKGGLIGGAGDMSVVSASYSIGRVEETGNQDGGLIGSRGSSVKIQSSYFDRGRTAQIACCGTNVPSPDRSSKTSTELRAPTTAVGTIYAGWDQLDVDGDGDFNDAPWDFGSSLDYPVLRGVSARYPTGNSTNVGVQRRLQPPVLVTLSQRGDDPIAEGSTVTYAVELDFRSRAAVTVSWSVELVGVGARHAEAADFSGATRGTITLVNTDSAVFSIRVTEDGTPERREMFRVRVSNLQGPDNVHLSAASSAVVSVIRSHGTDYDLDNDNLIEVTTRSQLEAIGYDLGGMGLRGVADGDVDDYEAAFPLFDEFETCPGRCKGYELSNDLDLSGEDWVPIGGGGRNQLPGNLLPDENRYNGTFEGNGYVIENMRIVGGSNRWDFVGLFRGLGAASVVRNVGLVDVNVEVPASSVQTGALAGVAYGRIASSYVVRGSVTGSWGVGGLVGALTGAKGRVVASYTNVSVSAATVPPNRAKGGLIGGAGDMSVVSASYSIGRVEETGNQDGGLIGSRGSSVKIQSSYFDRGRTAQIACCGTNVPSPDRSSKTSTELRAPTTAVGTIYAGWDQLDVDGDGDFNDAPWDFGSSLDYPVLRGVSARYPTGNSTNVGVQRRLQPPVLVTLSQRGDDPIAEGSTVTYAVELDGVVGIATMSWLVETVGVGPVYAEAADFSGATRGTITLVNTDSAVFSIRVTEDGASERREMFRVRLSELQAPDNVRLSAASSAVVSVIRSHGTDYDLDNDNLIEVTTRSQLEAIGYDLGGMGLRGVADGDMVAYDEAFPFFDESGCPGGCKGYELVNDLDLSGGNWDPIGGGGRNRLPGDLLPDENRYHGTFEGNGHVIENMRIVGGSNRWDFVGLFRGLGAASVVRNVGLVDVNVTVDETSIQTGALAGVAYGRIASSYVVRGSVTGGWGVGGLVGALTGAKGRVVASYTNVSVSAATVPPNRAKGGLIGGAGDMSVVSASYSIGRVEETGNQDGGLIGSRGSSVKIQSSYFDRGRTAQIACCGTNVPSPDRSSKTSTELRAPTTAVGTIYAGWDQLDVDGDGDFNDAPWDFGSSSDYPVLRGVSARYPTGNSTNVGVQRRLQPPVLVVLSQRGDDPIAEGSTVTYAVELDFRSRAAVTVSWSVELVGVGARHAEAADFSGATRGTITLVNTDSAVFSIRVTEDGASERRESYRVRVSNLQGPDNVRLSAASSAVVSAIASHGTDYDLDNDNLIEVTTRSQLEAIGYDLGGMGLRGVADGDDAAAYEEAFPGFEENGCPGGCKGYELSNDLDLSGEDWVPIGGGGRNQLPGDLLPDENRYNGTFEGHGYVIENMRIVGGSNRWDFVGLFRGLGAASVVRNVGLVDVSVTVDETSIQTGALAGVASGRIASSYVVGGEVHGGWGIGGLVGTLDGSGIIIASYADVLVDSLNRPLGGLAGRLSDMSIVSASYTVAMLRRSGSEVGGLAGARATSAEIQASYFDRVRARLSSCCGTNVPSPDRSSKTSTELRAPTTAVGTIYAGWDQLDLDGDGDFNDAPWDFGSSSDYPVLRGVSARYPTGNSTNVGVQRRLQPPVLVTLSQRGDDPIAEGSTVTYAVELDFRSRAAVTVSWSVELVGVGARHAEAADFSGATRGTITLVNTDSAVFSIRVTEDGTPERREMFRVRLSELQAPDNVRLSAASSAVVSVIRSHGTDYDLDNDNLIEVTTRSQLEAIGYDLGGMGLRGVADGDMVAYDEAFPFFDESGCPGGCKGYELVNDLDLSGGNWDPIGGGGRNQLPGNLLPDENRYHGTFEGHGHVIENMRIVGGSNRWDFVGLFRGLGAASVVRNVGLVDVNVTVDETSIQTGALAGVAYGRIASSYVVRGSVTGGWGVGGLVGALTGAKGRVVASYTNVSVSAATVPPNRAKGGLIGGAGDMSVVSASYSIGRVEETGNQDGGLIGSRGSSVKIQSSYFDRGRTAQIACCGTNVPSPDRSSKTSTELRAPTTAVGTIYAGWDQLDLDGDGDFNDAPWDFGSSSDYPVLRGVSARYPTGNSTNVGVQRRLQPPVLVVLSQRGDDPIAEGSTVTYAVELDFRSRAAVTVSWSVELVGVGARHAEAADFVGATRGTVTLVDTASAVFGIRIAEDGTSESREAFRVRLSSLQAPDGVRLSAADSAVVSAIASHGTDYDLDNDNLIEVTTRSQLEAIGYDLGGMGLRGVADGDVDDYEAAFPLFDEFETCPGRCKGYELLNDLDLSGGNWDPIGGGGRNQLPGNLLPDENRYHGTFEGNGHVIENMRIVGGSNRWDFVGLFRGLGAASVVRNVGLVDVNVTVDETSIQTGALAGVAYGRIASSYVVRGSVTGGWGVGGLVGALTGAKGRVVASYTNVSVSAATVPPNRAKGGLIGGAGDMSVVSASYSIGRVEETGNQDGGLIGSRGSSVKIQSSYFDRGRTAQIACCGTNVPSPDRSSKTSTELRAPTTAVGTIYAGWDQLDVDGDGDFNDAPWDFGSSSDYPVLRGVSARYPTGNSTNVGVQRRLQPPVLVTLSQRGDDPIAEGSTVTYAVELDFRSRAAVTVSWSVELVGVGARHAEAADFSGATRGTITLVNTDSAVFSIRVTEDGASERRESYRVRVSNLQGPDNVRLSAASSAVVSVIRSHGNDYDPDDNNLIDVMTTTQLKAIRYDLGGMGLRGVADGDMVAYEEAFPFFDESGCPGGCKGYELVNDLDLSGDDWIPIGGGSPLAYYTAVFEGNGHVISNLRIDTSADLDYAALFGAVGVGGRIRNVGVRNARVRVGDGSVFTSALVGRNDGRVAACWVAGGGVTGGWSAGALAGVNRGVVIGSYADVEVHAAMNNSGGLIGEAIAGSVVSASYSIGRVQSGGARRGGLVGQRNQTDADEYDVQASYYNRERSGQSSCCGRNMPSNDAHTSRTVVQLRAPTTAVGTIYAGWDQLDVDGVDQSNDGDLNDDAPWDFGSGLDYPMLRGVSARYPTGNTAGIGVQRRLQPPVLLTLSQRGADLVTEGQDVEYIVELDVPSVSQLVMSWSVELTGAGDGHAEALDFDGDRDGLLFLTNTNSVVFRVGIADDGTSERRETFRVRVSGFLTSSALRRRLNVASSAVVSVIAPNGKDYDPDGNNLINVATTSQLAAIRYDLGGAGLRGVADGDVVAYDEAFPFFDEAETCAGGCKGYELSNDVDLSSVRNWTPLGGGRPIKYYTAVFEGNGHVVSNLRIQSSLRLDNAGLFGAVSSAGTIRNVGLWDVNVEVGGGSMHTGALVGRNEGKVAACYVTGGSVKGVFAAGGLAGANHGTVLASYAAVRVHADALRSGGLIGRAAIGSVVSASYSIGRVTGGAHGASIYRGGLVGGRDEADAAEYDVQASYFDHARSGQTSCCGENEPSPDRSSRTSTELRAPTAAAGIYAGWDQLDVDGVASTAMGVVTLNDDAPWDFGSRFDYPALRGVSIRYPGGNTTSIRVQRQRQPSVPVVMLATPAYIRTTESDVELRFEVALSPATTVIGEDVTIHYQVSGTATAGADYRDEDGGMVVMAAGTTRAVIRLRLLDDYVIEPEEELVLRLLRTRGDSVAVATTRFSTVVTIANDDRLVVVDARVYLQGAYGGSRGMSTGLIDVLPRRQPYNVAPWNYPAATTVPHVGEGSGLSGVTSTIVDWVLVEVRTGATADAALASAPTTGGRAAGLLLRDGRIAGINEEAATAADALFLDGVRFETELLEGGQVYVLVHHRNHLSVISANALAPGGEGCTAGYCVDFRFAQSHGDGQAEVGQGTYAMFAGDVDRNGVIDERDEVLIRVHNLRSLGAGAYRDPDAAGNYAVDADLDFDGEVLSADRCFVLAPGNQGRCRTFSAP